MKEHPMLFKGEMVRANLDGHKTNTRRIITPRNSFLDGRPWSKAMKDSSPDWDNAWVDSGPSPDGNPGPYLHLPFPEFGTTHRIYPRYVVGDHIWVRETMQWNPLRLKYIADGSYYAPPDHEAMLNFQEYGNKRKGGIQTVPSIHMPRWACRTILEITDVRVERIQDISEEDVRSEGINGLGGMVGANTAMLVTGTSSLEGAEVVALFDNFIHLWDSINAARGYPWESNSWVFALTYKVIS